VLSFGVLALKSEPVEPPFIKTNVSKRGLLYLLVVDGNIDLTESRRLHMETLSRDSSEAACRQTRRIYDLVAPLYSISSQLFHSRAHSAALAASGIKNGMRVLEVGMGSGEMFHQLIQLNPAGETIGTDLSPNMAERSQTIARQRFPKAAAHCQSADVRYLPFATGSFDAIMCCYLFELLPPEDVARTVGELRRVLKSGGRLTVILVAQNKASFNALYKMAGRAVPAFWGRQVEKSVAPLLTSKGFRIHADRYLRQLFYSSRVLSAAADS
jgi:ubiquinone/menaquinone biosynthesis C-methylase UbiE